MKLTGLPELDHALAMRQLRETYRAMFRWSDDVLDSVDFMLGAYLSPSLPHSDSPVWVIFTGPPSAGKSSLIRGFGGLPWSIELDHFTENAFASAFKAQDGEEDVSIARSLCEGTEPVGPKVLSISEFSTLITMASDKIGKFWSDLRQIYDHGRFTSHSGNQGRMTWEIGRIGLLIGYPEVADRFVRGSPTLGERLVIFRMFPRPLTIDERLCLMQAEPNDERFAALKKRARDLKTALVMSTRHSIEQGRGRPHHPEAYWNRVGAWATITAYLRTFANEEGEVVSDAELPFRLRNQAVTWADSYCLVAQKDSWDDHCMRLIRRMYHSSVTIYNLNLFRALVETAWEDDGKWSLLRSLAHRMRVRSDALPQIEAQLHQWAVVGFLEQEGNKYRVPPNLANLVRTSGYLEPF